MQIPITIEPLGTNRFRAEAPPPFNVSAEGQSSSEAVENLRLEIEREADNGRRIVVLDVQLPGENPWVKFAGHLKDDPLFEEWQAAVTEYRAKRDPEDA